MQYIVVKDFVQNKKWRQDHVTIVLKKLGLVFSTNKLI